MTHMPGIVVFHKLIRLYMEGLILGVNTLYMLICCSLLALKQKVGAVL